MEVVGIPPYCRFFDVVLFGVTEHGVEVGHDLSKGWVRRGIKTFLMWWLNMNFELVRKSRVGKLGFGLTLISSREIGRAMVL